MPLCCQIVIVLHVAYALWDEAMKGSAYCLLLPFFWCIEMDLDDKTALDAYMSDRTATVLLCNVVRY